MDFYDFLRRLAEARPFQAYEQREAIEIIEEYRQLNIFGSLARQIREEHAHDWVPQRTGRVRCSICTEERDYV